jgi:hypothetical protein
LARRARASSKEKVVAAEGDAVRGEEVAERVDGGTEGLGWVVVLGQRVEEEVEDAGAEGTVSNRDAEWVEGGVPEEVLGEEVRMEREAYMSMEAKVANMLRTRVVSVGPGIAARRTRARR